jgi:hypothetical protein
MGQMGAPAWLPSSRSSVRAPEPSRVSPQTIQKSGPQPAPPNTGFVLTGVGSSFKTALELAQSFRIGVPGSQVCPYCYNTGYSSPGTRWSYCRMGEKMG